MLQDEVTPDDVNLVPIELVELEGTTLMTAERRCDGAIAVTVSRPHGKEDLVVHAHWHGHDAPSTRTLPPEGGATSIQDLFPGCAVRLLVWPSSSSAPLFTLALKATPSS